MQDRHPLFKAIEQGDIISAQSYLESQQYTANAIENGDSIFHHATLYSDIKAMQLLLDNGANIDSKGYPSNSTALHVAITNLEKTKFLLSHNANINAKDTLGETPLITCMYFSERKIYPCLELLLQQTSIDINATNNRGQTALHQSIIRNKINLMKLLLQYKANIHIIDNTGKSAFHYAASCPHLQVIQLLLRYGANAYQTTNDEKTPLQLALAADEQQYPFKNKVIQLLTLLTIHTDQP